MEAASGAVRFTMAERQLKLFKNALQSLSKIGSDLLVEALTGRVGAQPQAAPVSGVLPGPHLHHLSGPTHPVLPSCSWCCAASTPPAPPTCR